MIFGGQYQLRECRSCISLDKQTCDCVSLVMHLEEHFKMSYRQNRLYFLHVGQFQKESARMLCWRRGSSFSFSVGFTINISFRGVCRKSRPSLIFRVPHHKFSISIFLIVVPSRFCTIVWTYSYCSHFFTHQVSSFICFRYCSNSVARFFFLVLGYEISHCFFRDPFHVISEMFSENVF